MLCCRNFHGLPLWLTPPPGFFDDNDCSPPRALLNPRVPSLVAYSEKLERVAAVAGLAGHRIFATSGSTDDPKFVCLSQRALEVSARAVNDHLAASENDTWLCALPTFHVGGIGIWIRARLNRAKVIPFHHSQWDAAEFGRQLVESTATFDVVSAGPTPRSDGRRGSASRFAAGGAYWRRKPAESTARICDHSGLAHSRNLRHD